MDSIEKLFKYSQVFRSYPLCHSFPERSFSYQGRYFGLCARCTTMYLGGVITLLTFPFWVNSLSPFSAFWGGCTLLIPGGIDGVTQMFGERESNNEIRAVTGFLLGIGIVLVSYAAIFSLL